MSLQRTTVGCPLATDPSQGLRSAVDYRIFLKTYLDSHGLNLSDFARATGFGRGYPSDVLSGRRRLTLKSLRTFEGALKLPATGRKLFRLLVAREERDLFPEWDLAFIEESIRSLRARPWGRAHRELRSKELSDRAEILRDPLTLVVYAAAGSPGAGATFEQLRIRTRCADRDLERVLKGLEQVGLIQFSENRYEPADLHLFLKTSDQGELLRDLFRAACQTASQRILSPDAADSRQEMFFTSAFCVDEKKMPELKTALRKTILQFVDDSIRPEGDRVVRLVAAMHV